MQDAAELVAAAHVANRHVVGIDHAGLLFAWTRLPDHAQHDQPIQHDDAGAVLWPRSQLLRSTSMKTVLDSGIELTPDQASAMRREAGHMAHATPTIAPVGDVTESVPSSGERNFRPSPVRN